MSTDEYVPHEDDVRSAWVGRLGTDTPLFTDEADAEFDRFLARVRRDAYDEGYEDARHDEREHRPWRKSTHPYRQEQTNE